MRQFFIVVTMLFCIGISAQIQIDFTENQTITLVDKQIPTDGGYITLRNVPDGNYKIKVLVGGDIDPQLLLRPSRADLCARFTPKPVKLRLRHSSSTSETL